MTTVKQAFELCDDPSVLKDGSAVIERLTADDYDSLPEVLKRTCDVMMKSGAIPVDINLKWLPDCDSIQVRVFGVKS